MSPEAPRRPRPFALVASALLAVAALTLIVAGGALLWGDAQKDRDGYLTTSSERFSTRTAALATENLDADLDGLDAVAGDDVLGSVRLTVAPEGGKPVFAGIARTSDVRDYLRGSAHTVVRDVDTDPFRADYRDRPGERRLAPPAERSFWAATASDGRLDWKVQDGDWSVVVMNADGSPGVAADVKAGADVPFLDEAGWIVLGGGTLVLLLAGGVLYLAVRRPAQRRPEEPNPLAPRSVASS
jgi:hypothetical protein